MEPLSDFAVKTHAELARLTLEAADIRARMPQHRPCPDEGACRHCERLRTIHRLLDDHLAQLRGEPAEPTPVRNALLASYAADKFEDRTRQPICACGRSKYVIKDAAMVCLDCDHVALPKLGLGGAS